VNTFLKNKEELLNGSETWILQVSINVKNIHVVNGLNFTFRVDELNLTQNEYLTSYAKEILIDISNKNNINYWYPSGYGKQTQYKLKVICKSENIELVKEKKIAFRKVKLIESDLNPQTGKSFYFQINDIPIFLKGANWMPNLLFSDQFNSEREKVLFDAVKFANINCLRVVGYESANFYEKTDELGILVMQIFMFDSAYYPVNSDFVENVMEELIQQLRRLRQHSSIIAWIGNNKIEQAMYENWFNLTDSELYINDYIKLFVHHFGRQISEHDKSNRAYLSSSPSNGANKSYELNPNSVSHGDFHIEYESNFWDWENFKLARCLTQFGTKSYPSFLVLKKSSDLSKLIKSIETNENEIAKSIQTNMRLPVNLESGDMLEYVIYLSQIDQAMSLKEGIEYYRRSNYDPFTSMGFFSKQLNDVSIGPSSTATVDFDLNYKIGHYFIKNSFSKYLLSASIDKSSRSLRFYFVSDSLNNVTGRALIKFFSLEKLASTKYEASLSINANRQSVQHIGQLTFDEIKTRSGCEFNSTENSCVIILEYALDGSDEKSSQNFFLMNRNLKEMKIRKIPTIRVEKVNRVNEKTFSIDINTDEPALFVWLEVPNGIFSPNGFHLVEARKTVQLELENSSQISDKELMELIRIKSLMNAYGYPISISKTNNGMMLGSFNFFLFFSIVFALYWVQIV
jgi:beta-mannosidase